LAVPAAAITAEAASRFAIFRFVFDIEAGARTPTGPLRHFIIPSSLCHGNRPVHEHSGEGFPNTIGLWGFHLTTLFQGVLLAFAQSGPLLKAANLNVKKVW
jgi:hypothetical protein